MPGAMPTTQPGNTMNITTTGVRRGIASALLSLIIAATACERPVLTDDLGTATLTTDANVTLTFIPYIQTPFYTVSRGTASAQEPELPYTRLSVAVFTADGTKLRTINQKNTDSSFGTVALSLSSGTYKVVAIAHSSTEGNATITSPEKVTFANNKVTDTFSFCGNLTVEDEPVSRTIQLQRVVAMFRLNLTDETIPSAVSRLKFYYTGGSSTLDPSASYGCVNSKQTEYRPCFADDGSAIVTYDLYTIPHEQSDIIKLTITALTADNTPVGEWTMEEIPVTQNKITTWTGPLFSTITVPDDGTGTSTTSTLSVSIDPTWSGTIPY